MAQIQTRFNVGDQVVTLDEKTKKAVEITIGSISAIIGKNSTATVSYYPQKENGEVDFYTSYDEKACFTNKEQLMQYIFN